MGYALLWIEGLAVGLLLIGLATACAARLDSRRWQRAWAGGVLLLVVLPAAALTAALWWIAGLFPLHTWLFFYVLSWTVAYSLLGVLVIVRGLRPASQPDGASAQASAEPRARGWWRGQFVTWLIIVLVVQTHTFFTIDLRVRSALKAMNEKALAVARSLEPAPIPDEQNAAGRYSAAAKSLGYYSGFAMKFGSFEDMDFDAKQPGLVKALQKRQAALADAREATKLPACFENSSFVHGTRIKYEVPDLLTDLMDVARFLATDAKVKATAGDVAGALEDLAAIKRLAAHVSRHPTLVSQMIAMAIDAYAAKVLEPVLAAAATPLPPELIPMPVAVRELERDNWVRAFQFEEAWHQSSTVNALMDHRVADEFLAVNAMMDHRVAEWLRITMWLPSSAVVHTLFRVFFARRELAELQKYKHHQKMIAVAEQPYHVSREALTRLANPVSRRGYLTAISIPNLTVAFEAFARARAAARLYALTLAAAAFQARTGRYPQSAAELVPAYITEIPTDPFSGKPLRLKPIAGGLIFYSVGNDGKDNGGKRGSDHLSAEEGEDIVFHLGAAYKK